MKKINLIKKLEVGIKNTTPGVQVLALHKGKVEFKESVGETYKFYDLASLTKVISATTFLMWKQIKPEVKLKTSLDWFSYDTNLKSLLNHTAGFPWWIPVYKEMTQENILEWSREEKRYFLERLLRDQKPDANQKKAVYSDVDFFFLKAFLESYYNLPYESLYKELQEDLNLKNLDYHPENKPLHKVTDYAPTEACPWRKITLQGQVHDDNTWAMGGVSTHAGLFGTLDSVAHWALEIRKGLKGENKKLNQKIVKQYTSRSIPKEVGDWALGFMMPTPGQSSCGKYFSENSFGHTGFTGTSVWFDPKKDLIVIILSNRVHPTRENENFKKLRPLIHDWIMEEMELV